MQTRLLDTPIWVAVLALSACASAGADKPETPAVPAPTEAAAPPEEVNAFEACKQPAKRKEILVDEASRRLLQTVCGAALWFDGLFGDRDLDAARNSYGRVEISDYYSQFKGYEPRVRFDVRLKLPALHERLSAFFGRDDEDDFVRDRTEGHALRSTSRTTDRDQFLAGLGFVLKTTDTFQSEFKVGVRNLRMPQAFAQNRFIWIPYSNSQNRVLVRMTPFWNTRDHLGVTTSTDFDRILGERFLLRWGNTGTISQNNAGFDWRTAAILYQNLRGSSALAYEIFVRGATGAPEPLGEYGVRNVYRRPFFHEHLFGNLVLGYSWPRDDPALPRQGSFDLGLGVEMPFGVAPK